MAFFLFLKFSGQILEIVVTSSSFTIINLYTFKIIMLLVAQRWQNLWTVSLTEQRTRVGTHQYKHISLQGSEDNVW